MRLQAAAAGLARLESVMGFARDRVQLTLLRDGEPIAPDALPVGARIQVRLRSTVPGAIVLMSIAVDGSPRLLHPAPVQGGGLALQLNVAPASADSASATVLPAKSEGEGYEIGLPLGANQLIALVLPPSGADGASGTRSLARGLQVGLEDLFRYDADRKTLPEFYADIATTLGVVANRPNRDTAWGFATLQTQTVVGDIPDPSKSAGPTPERPHHRIYGEKRAPCRRRQQLFSRGSRPSSRRRPPAHTDRNRPVRLGRRHI